MRAGASLLHGSLVAKLLTVFVLLLAAAEHAAANSYLVEVLAFESRGTESSGEYFPTVPATPGEGFTPVPQTVRYTGTGLAGVAATLAKHPAYRLLLNASWQQSLPERAAAPAVPVAPPDPQRPTPELTGTLRLHEAAPLLFVEVDLRFSPTAEPASYRLHEKRRIKLNELHYFDHPRFGALVRVSRVNP